LPLSGVGHREPEQHVSDPLLDAREPLGTQGIREPGDALHDIGPVDVLFKPDETRRILRRQPCLRVERAAEGLEVVEDGGGVAPASVGIPPWRPTTWRPGGRTP
jgi:hypothetical protein